MGDHQKLFPVLNPPDGCAKYVPWSMIDRAWAYMIHNETLEYLAAHGGLGPHEIYWNIHRLNWGYRVTEATAVRLVNAMADTLSRS